MRLVSQIDWQDRQVQRVLLQPDESFFSQDPLWSFQRRHREADGAARGREGVAEGDGAGVRVQGRREREGRAGDGSAGCSCGSVWDGGGGVSGGGCDRADS